VQSWDGVRLELLKWGYRRALFYETHCPQDGVWRIGVAEEQEIYACPQCGQACKVKYITEGFTRRALPLDPQFLEKPLRAWVRKLIMTDGVLDENRPRARTGQLRKGWRPNALRPLGR
jgi:hypothetical protein